MLKIVKGATKPKAAAPKAKYIEPILVTTFEEGKDFQTVMESLAKTLNRSPTWTTTYKSLIVVHIMIREGAEDTVLKYLAKHPRMLELDEATARGAAGLGRYARYLAVRGAKFKETKVDYVRYKTRQGHGRLYGLTVDKGLLRECESVIGQIDALLKCHFEEQDVDNDVILMAFRLLVHDLLSLFQVLNEGVINLLEHYFELSKVDAEHALDVYRGFTRLTSKVISYLRVAKNLEYQTKFHVPNIKHAPTSLVSSLEMYLNDPDFQTNRRQYLAEKQAHDRRRDTDRPQGELQKQLTPQQREISSQLQAQTTAFSPPQQPAPPALAQAQPQPQALHTQLQAQLQSQPQSQPQPQTQPGQPSQSGQPGLSHPGQAQPSQGFDFLNGDLIDFGQPQQQPQQQAQQQPQQQQGQYNPFYNQQQQQLQSESLAQQQAVRIQQEQNQAQLQLQQLQLQQQQLQQQSQLLQQQQTGWDFNYGQASQPQTPQPQTQPQTPQPSIMPVGEQQTGQGFSYGYGYAQPQQPQQQQPQSQTGYYQQPQAASPTGNPFKRNSQGPAQGATNPFARQTSVHHPAAAMTPQMTAQGTNPFRNSLI